ncbi:MAG: putative ABC transporter permease [Bacilli bacterium]
MKKIFAKGICFNKLFYIFMIGSVFGAYYEEIACFISKMINHQPLVWQYFRGLIYGPFSPVYGFGAVFLTILLVRKKRSNITTFFLAFLGGGFIEYITSFLQETFVGSISWDYSNKFLNINGRTTIIYMLFWGLLGLVFVKYIYPFISNLIEKIPYKTGTILTKILIVLMVFNMFISWTALFRQTRRHDGQPPITKIGEIYDKIYPDSFLKKIYSNMTSK